MKNASGSIEIIKRTVNGFSYTRTLLVLALISYCLLTSRALCQENEPSRKRALKAAFLFYVSAQIDDAITGEKMASILPTLTPGKRICIVGSADLFLHLKEQLKYHVVDGRHFDIIHSADLDPSVLRGCSLTYIDGCSSTSISSSPLSNLSDDGVASLTIGTGKSFLETGGMMRLYIQSNRLKFEINKEAMKKAKITLPEEVVSLASTPQDGEADYCP